MKGRTYQLIAASSVAAVLALPVLAAENLLTNGDFEQFLGPFPNSSITTDQITWNTWFASSGFQSVDSRSLVEPILPLPSPFPPGWGGNNFAQSLGGSEDLPDQLAQGIEGKRIKQNIPVTLSFKFINTEPGGTVTVRVYGIYESQFWSLSEGCVGCVPLYQAAITTAYNSVDVSLGWQTFSGTFTPTATYPVVAVGVEIGGNPGYARGVDDIVLNQNQPPVCSGAKPSVATLWPPNHRWVPINILGVTDLDGDAVAITVESIYQDEPVKGTGSGDTSPDGNGVGTPTAQVRAERAGNGDGRVYHIAFTADDGNGGTCEGTVLVSVPKSQGKNGAAVDGGVLYDSTKP